MSASTVSSIAGCRGIISSILQATIHIYQSSASKNHRGKGPGNTKNRWAQDQKQLRGSVAHQSWRPAEWIFRLPPPSWSPGRPASASGGELTQPSCRLCETSAVQHCDSTTGSAMVDPHNGNSKSGTRQEGSAMPWGGPGSPRSMSRLGRCRRARSARRPLDRAAGTPG